MAKLSSENSLRRNDSPAKPEARRGGARPALLAVDPNVSMDSDDTDSTPNTFSVKQRMARNSQVQGLKRSERVLFDFSTPEPAKSHYTPQTSRQPARPNLLQSSLKRAASERKPDYKQLLMSNRQSPSDSDVCEDSSPSERKVSGRRPAFNDDWEDEDEVTEDDGYYSGDYGHGYGQDSPETVFLGTPSPAKGSGGTGTGKKRRHFMLDPEMPGILAGYLRLLFNIVMLSMLVYSVWIFLSTISSDIDQKVEEYSAEILEEMAQCSREYMRNNCVPGRRVPALESACTQWEKCMNQDPTVVGRARVSAETFGEIINSFLKPIGLKSMIFMVSAFCGSFALVNVAFSWSRPSMAHTQMAQPRMPPQTPLLAYTPRGPHYTVSPRGPRWAPPSSRRRRRIAN